VRNVLTSDIIEQMKIVGIAGLPRSGKDTLAELFMEHGYFGMSLGDIVRNASRQRHADKPDPISVKNMTETANHLRTEYGPDFALKEALARFDAAKTEQNYKGLVVFSVRVPAEVDFILSHDGELIWVEASDEARHRRATLYRRKGEAKTTLQEMKAQEALQEKPQPGIPAAVQMNTGYVKERATKTIENNIDDIAVFRTQAEDTLGFNR
jgi:dephospho-CoA kinase